MCRNLYYCFKRNYQQVSPIVHGSFNLQFDELVEPGAYHGRGYA